MKAALGDIADMAADARAKAAIKAAQTEMRLLKEAEAMEAEIAAARKRSGTLDDALERSRDPETLLREIAETRAHLDASDAKRRATERDLDLAGRAVREAERENDELKRRLTSREAREEAPRRRLLQRLVGLLQPPEAAVHLRESPPNNPQGCCSGTRARQHSPCHGPAKPARPTAVR